ncbi:MAG: ATP synthase F0 subunit B [Clostridiales bacterium]|jgi:F-type H+-transporting ATPase subunit b|nr:ATP synthase F0 subunit B [Clostridia bacterium]MDI9511590.1 ATP synthase F0 subunit B [Bacillota bacterium]NLH57923.1 ATP synthase F0 subunit B [Clostridiales bacterium]
MNLPLNIDLQQILLHLFNFTILAFGLYLLLYNPVKKFMREREDYYLGLDQNAVEKLESAEGMEATYKEKLDKAEIEIAQMKAQAVKEAQEAADLVIEKAKKEAEDLLKDARDTAMRERKKILADTQEEIASLAYTAAKRMVAQSATESLDQFLHAVKQE